MDQDKLKLFEPGEKVGIVMVVTGQGKGKTTSALGIALRAVGYDMKVCIIEFIKGDMYSGEIDGIKRLSPNVELHLTGKGFCGIMEDPYPFSEHRANAQDALKLAKEKLFSGNFDILILDEINNALRLKLVDLPQILELIDNKPPLIHLILTGRDAHPEVIKRAHTVTEMKEIKHAYRLGIEPQKGIDY
ncbi:MAG: cob(I)yrinic acid a,c-diamide adenosyltransferase [Nitrospirae bacterium]|nr:cob(I)yrinic acid a,c-diamide adenosyltransferase [Nitrospirota bacterium]